MINCRRVTLGMGGSKAVISAPRLTIQLGHGIHHFASVLCLLALLGNLVLVQSVLSGLIHSFLRPPGSTMPERERERERKSPGEVLPGTVVRQGRDACTIWRGLCPSPGLSELWPHMPPMAFVEEEFPEEPIQVPPESLLYTVLDAHIRPNTSVVVTGTTTTMDGATCIVQEEFPTLSLHR
jgi:hypothetical protein